MSYEKAKELLNKYRAGNCTEAEQALVEKWLFQHQNEEVGLSDERIEEIGQEIWFNLPKPPVKIIKGALWLRVAAAAAVLVFVSAGLYFVKSGSSATHYEVIYKKDIAPGGNKAVLTLAGGKKIVLTDVANGQLANEGNVVINKTNSGEVVYHNVTDITSNSELTYNTITTPRSGQYHLILADGTQVWLNSESSIKYPVAFTGKDRKVEVTGEAYFEVVHNAAQPFSVLAGKQLIEDIGTHFNVNSYANEPVAKTTLLEGSVKVTNDQQSAVLIPGQQVMVENGSSIKVLEHADTEESIAWKNGLFQFNKAGIETIMRQASRWYNVDVVYASGEKPAKTFTGNISRNSTLAEFLRIISYTGGRFEINGNKIIVKTE